MSATATAMDQSEIERVGAALAVARTHDTIVGRAVDLRRIGSFEEATIIQAAAAQAYSEDRIGYALAGTSSSTARLLHCDHPVVGPLFAQDRLLSGDSRQVTGRMLGVGAQFAFVFGRSFPQNEAERIDPASVGEAIACCRLSLQVVARRVAHLVPLNDWTATADFGLSHSYVEGPTIENWRDLLVGDTSVGLCLDGKMVAEGRADAVMTHPLAAVAWLAGHMIERDALIEAGDVVATGSCTGLVQMTPGHVVAGDFGRFGSVELRLD